MAAPTRARVIEDLGLPLRVLMVEDSEDDAALLARELRRGGYEPAAQRVDCEEAMRIALSQGKWDIIICDYSLPYFSGLAALKLLRETDVEAPFIFVSGTMGEDTAVAALKLGAQDYLMKDNLKRLVPAIQRELLEVEHRRQRSHLEKEVQQLQKFEAIGRLAGGVAHDFNNLLGIVTASTELLRGRVEDCGVEYLDNICQAARRGAALTRQLLAFGRQQQVQPQVLDLNERVNDVSKLLRPLLGDDVEIVLLARATTATIKADPGQLDQVLLNLAVNARDAMPRGGKLILETAAFDHDGSFPCDHSMAWGRYVMLAVSDNGSGMDEATRSRIFEPFFTTKEVGKGTGLGLATVYGIVKQCGGHIWVYSELGRGTTFKIYFPIVTHKKSASSESYAQTLPPKREGKTILLTEDDPTIRKLTRTMLEDHGYRVFEAEDGTSALETIATHHASIDLILTDVVMKSMSGPELVGRLMNSHPSMKVIYMSGYTGEMVANQGPDNNIRVLEKPFTRAELLKAIDVALR